MWFVVSLNALNVSFSILRNEWLQCRKNREWNEKKRVKYQIENIIRWKLNYYTYVGEKWKFIIYIAIYWNFQLLILREDIIHIVKRNDTFVQIENYVESESLSWSISIISEDKRIESRRKMQIEQVLKLKTQPIIHIIEKTCYSVRIKETYTYTLCRLLPWSLRGLTI